MGTITRVDADRRIRVPEELGAAYAPEQEVELVLQDDGVLIRPLRKAAIQVALGRKVQMRQPTHLDLSDLNMDEFGW